MVVPLCRCRVLYIGSAVPTITKDGLQGIQQPLKERYPINEATETKGIDSWLSVWSNGLLLEYIDGAKKTETAFFPITTLHYCAAVRYVSVEGFSIEGGGERFIPLDAPFAQIPDSPHPPIFAAIFRRTTGVKVLECHAFICTNEKAANALVRCCFHSYADTIYLKMDEKIPGLKAIKESSNSRSTTPLSDLSEPENTTLDETNWNERAIGQKTWQRRHQNGEFDETSLSSSMFKKSSKKSGGRKQHESRSEFFEREGVLLPYHENGNVRRSGSHSELRARGDARDYYEHLSERGAAYHVGRIQHPHHLIFGGGTPYHYLGGGVYPPPPFVPPPPRAAAFFSPPPPPPGFFRGAPHPAQRMPYPPPPPFIPFHPIPPPHLLPPSPPHLRSRLAGGMSPSQMGFYPPPPPHMLPPRGMFFYPPPPFGMFPTPYYRGHNNMRSKSPVEGSGPIITESLYDTFPRRETYEEPIYMPSSNSGMPPHSSYKPDSMSPEHYETYYDSYRHHQHNNHRTSDRKNNAVSRSGSDASGEGSNHFWENYEAGIYRKTHIHEKAFVNSVAAVSKQQQQNGGGDASHTTTVRANGEDADSTLKRPTTTTTVTGEQRQKSEIRPRTPPADYEYDDVAESRNASPPLASRINKSNSNNGTAAPHSSQRTNYVY